jgi:multidrug transporter EmrE-like cation transporter
MIFNLHYGLLVISSVILCIGNLCIKYSRISSEGLISPFFVLGIALFTFNMFIYSETLRILPLSVAYPIFSSLAFVFITIASHFIFNETITLIQIVGILLVILGIAVMVK